MKFRDEDGRTHFMAMAEVMGYPNFYLGEESFYEDLVNDEPDQSAYLESYEGIPLYDYEEYAACINAGEPDTDALPLIRLLISLTRCSAEDSGALAEKAAGHFLDEIEIPIPDVEEEIGDEWYK